MILEDAKGGSRSDWLAFRMLIERELGDKAKVGPLRKALLAQQNSDGGWGLVRGDPSHALVTGQAGDAGTAADIAGANGTGTERALTVEAKGIERGAITRASRAKAHGGFFSPLRRDALVDLRARQLDRLRPFAR